MQADRDDSNDRRGDSYRGDSRSPPYDDRFSERLGTGGSNGDRNIRYVYGERSPGYDRGDNKRSPRRFEVVDDRVRDDRYGSGNRRPPDMASKPERMSPSRPKDVPSPPMVRPVRDILGDDAPQLRVGDTPKSNNVRVPDTSAPTHTSAPTQVRSTVFTGNNMFLYMWYLLEFLLVFDLFMPIHSSCLVSSF